MREPLQGDAAREALVAMGTEAARGMDGTILRRLVEGVLATGRVVVLPEEDAPCVSKLAQAVQPRLADYSDARPLACALHAAGLCPCAADALLRRWMTYNGAASVKPLVADTGAYLEGR